MDVALAGTDQVTAEYIDSDSKLEKFVEEIYLVPFSTLRFE